MQQQVDGALFCVQRQRDPGRTRLQAPHRRTAAPSTRNCPSHRQVHARSVSIGTHQIHRQRHRRDIDPRAVSTVSVELRRKELPAQPFFASHLATASAVHATTRANECVQRPVDAVAAVSRSGSAARRRAAGLAVSLTVLSPFHSQPLQCRPRPAAAVRRQRQQKRLRIRNALLHLHLHTRLPQLQPPPAVPLPRRLRPVPSRPPQSLSSQLCPPQPPPNHQLVQLRPLPPPMLAS